MTTLTLDKLTARIQAHKNALVHIVKPPVCTERARHYTEAYQQHMDKPIPVRRALALAQIHGAEAGLAALDALPADRLALARPWHVARADLLAKAPAGTIGVKLSTPRRGCSGLAYSVDYVTEANPMDERIETPGGSFFVDGASVLYLIGSTMDWVEDDFTAGFVFTNPNAKGACGCGESFTV